MPSARFSGGSGSRPGSRNSSDACLMRALILALASFESLMLKPILLMPCAYEACHRRHQFTAPARWPPTTEDQRIGSGAGSKTGVRDVVFGPGLSSAGVTSYPHSMTPNRSSAPDVSPLGRRVRRPPRRGPIAYGQVPARRLREDAPSFLRPSRETWSGTRVR